MILTQKSSGDTISHVAGLYEFARVTGKNGTELTLEAALTNGYADTDVVTVQRVPNYDDVTIASGGAITTSTWNGSGGGVVAFRVRGSLDVQSGGLIHVRGKGFAGGSRGATTSRVGVQGESYLLSIANPHDFQQRWRRRRR